MQEIHTYMPSCPQSLSSDMNSLNKKPAHRRKDSGELDVFEATRYFSGGIDGVSFVGASVGRRSSEMPMKSIDPPSQPLRVEKLVKDKKCKQPSSPGARLASFLNSFFHQTASKRKPKSSSTTTTPHPRSLKGGDEESLGGRKRRSSISLSQSIRNSDSRSIHSCGSTGFRTPSLYPNTPTMAQKELITTYQDSKCNVQSKALTFSPQSEKAKYSDGFFEKDRILGNGYLGSARRLYGNGFVEKDAVCSGGFVENRWVLNKVSDDGFVKKDRIWVGEFAFKGRKSFRRSEEVDEVDGESDCSSDLFELKNYDLPSGLPVYGTTDKDVMIKRGTAISSVAF